MECCWRSRSTLQRTLACGEYRTHVIFRSIINRSYQLSLSLCVHITPTQPKTQSNNDHLKNQSIFLCLSDWWKLWLSLLLPRAKSGTMQVHPVRESPRHRITSLTSVSTRASSATQTLQYPNCKRTPKHGWYRLLFIGCFLLHTETIPLCHLLHLLHTSLWRISAVVKDAKSLRQHSNDRDCAMMWSA
jgi:hypothetical protein